MPQISLQRALAFSFVAPLRHAGAILPRIVLPWLAGSLMLYGSLHLYLLRLQIFLAQPNDRTSSLVLGIAAAALLLLLFLHCMICASVAGVLLDRAERPAAYLRARRREWRLYAANLRFMFAAAAVLGILGCLGALLPQGVSRLVLGVMAVAFAAWFLARVWFLITPVSVMHLRGPILRRAWRLSDGNALFLAILLVALLLPGLVFEAAAEIILHGVGMLPAGFGGWSFAKAVNLYAQFLPVMSGLVSLVYLLSVLLLVAGQVAVFCQLAESEQN